MSVRSGRVVKTVRTLTRPSQEAACSFSTYSCTLARLHGFEYCSRHILEDKTAPFRQCNYIYTSTGKRCLRPAPTTDRKEGYCGEHSRQSLVVRQRAARKTCPQESPETLLTQLSHHQMDTHTAGQNAIPDPASVVGLASAALEYASDTDSEEEVTNLPHDALPRRDADSELDSADSDTDPLEHAQVFTTEEITRIYLEKLQKLKSMYVGEYKRLAHILRESRRKYIQAVRVEKESMGKLADIMLVISMSTAIVERGFSNMNVVKSATRTLLGIDTLNDLMEVKVNGPSLLDFKPEGAVLHWLDKGERKRHIDGHKCPK